MDGAGGTLGGRGGGCATLADSKLGITSQITKTFAFKTGRNGERVHAGCLVALTEIWWTCPVDHRYSIPPGQDNSQQSHLCTSNTDQKLIGHTRTSDSLAVTYRAVLWVRKHRYLPVSQAGTQCLTVRLTEFLMFLLQIVAP